MTRVAVVGPRRVIVIAALAIGVALMSAVPPAAQVTTIPPKSAGSDTQVQFNDNGATGGDAGLTYNKTTDVLSVLAAVTAGTNPATAGGIRVASQGAGALQARNAANTGNVELIRSGSGDEVVIGNVGAASVNINSPVVNIDTALSTPRLNQTPILFANLATALPANGDSGYCSDCTFANPCAGSGTGAIAKRLNGAYRCD